MKTPKFALSELTSSSSDYIEARGYLSHLSMKMEKQIGLCVIYEVIEVDQAHSTSAVVALEPL